MSPEAAAGTAGEDAARGGPEAAVEVFRLSKSYGSIRALNDASLSVARGEIFGLVGPNGAGKTTLIKALCGILKPDSGQVGVMGMDAGAQRYRVRSRLGYMPQTPALYEDLSPRENLKFFGSGYPSPGLDGQIRQALEFVELWDRADDPLHTFSGGMRQRTSLACALLRDPELLILDEPTAGVDPSLRQSFWRHFNELRERGRTLFISTNQMDEALRCDRVAVILAGRVMITEPPETIRARGKARITLRLADGSERVAEAAGYEEDLPRLLRDYGLKNDVNSISVSRPSLEDVILSLIGQQPEGSEAGEKGESGARDA